MKYFYDLEFLEDGHTIEFISIGIVAEDDRAYYGVAEEIGYDQLYERIIYNKWIMKNVIDQLPIARRANGERKITQPTNSYPQNPGFTLDASHPAVLPLHVITKHVKAFLYADPGPIELWAWYGAYDHVRLMQLWGSMMQRPDRLPMWTRDLNQHAEQKGFTPEEIAAAVPQGEGQHDALKDALHLRKMFQYLEAKP